MHGVTKLRRVQSLLRAALYASLVASCSSAQGTPSDECSRTASMRVYSNAWVHKETGDLLGYELAIKPLSDTSLDALLYVYEGGASDGIRLPGRISGKHVTIEG